MKPEKSLMLVLCALLAVVCGCGTDEPDGGQDTADTVAEPEVVDEPGADQGTMDATTEPDVEQEPTGVAAESDVDESTADIQAGPDWSEETTGDEAEPPEDFTNSIGMKFKLIPAGEFLMGSPEDKKQHDLIPAIGSPTDDETQHRVSITRPYCLGATEVTQGQWEQVMGTRPWEGPREGKPATESGSEHPASFVSWYDSVEFCRKLSAKEGREYRLPTEAEWEYACRAGSTTRYCFGDDDSDFGSYAWYFINTFHADEKYAHEVGLKRANAWGLYDMHGNVWEWCSDWYDSDYYEKSPVENPRGPSTGSHRASRGGGWSSSPRRCRSADRYVNSPGYRDYGLGFRVALDPAE